MKSLTVQGWVFELGVEVSHDKGKTWGPLSQPMFCSTVSTWGCRPRGSIRCTRK